MRVSLAVLALAVAGLTASAPAAHAACAGQTKSLGGTIEGEDGRFLSTVIGVELFDSGRHAIGIDGCPTTGGQQYAAIAKTNTSGQQQCCPDLDGHGAPASASGYGKSWRIDGLPDNTSVAWIETYPESKDTGSGIGVSYVRYGGAMRRYTALATDIRLRLPLACGSSENGVTGNNGSIAGRITRNGAAVDVKTVTAWTRVADGPSPIMGFVLAEGQPRGGSFRVPQLEPGQSYTVLVALADGSSRWFENDYGEGIPVTACAESTLDLDVATGAAVVNGAPRGGAAGPPPPPPAAAPRTPKPTAVPRTPRPSVVAAPAAATPAPTVEATPMQTPTPEPTATPEPSAQAAAPVTRTRGGSAARTAAAAGAVLLASGAGIFAATRRRARPR